MALWVLYTPKLPLWPLIGRVDLAGDRWCISELKLEIPISTRARIPASNTAAYVAFKNTANSRPSCNVGGIGMVTV
jgi:hypothetical protein